MEKKQDKVRVRDVIITFTLFFGMVAGCEHLGNKLEERDERKWQQEEMERIEDRRIAMINKVRQVKQAVQSGSFSDSYYEYILEVDAELNQLDDSRFEDELQFNLLRLKTEPNNQAIQDVTYKQLEDVEQYLLSNQPRL